VIRITPNAVAAPKQLKIFAESTNRWDYTPSKATGSVQATGRKVCAMQRVRLIAVPGILAVVSVTLSGASLFAATPSPSFTITATNAILSSSGSTGTGSNSFTLTSVNGYAGQVRVNCNPPTPPIGVKVPYCGNGVPSGGAVPVQPPITLTANETVTGTITFYNAPVPCSDPCPVSLPRRGGHGLPQALALAGALLLGFSFRRRTPRWLTMTLFAVGTLAGLAAISACGTSNVVTPGTYAYTISATDVTTAVSVTTSVNVTVP
jgi:hypothetical protein